MSHLEEGRHRLRVGEAEAKVRDEFSSSAVAMPLVDDSPTTEEVFKSAQGLQAELSCRTRLSRVLLGLLEAECHSSQLRTQELIRENKDVLKRNADLEAAVK